MTYRPNDFVSALEKMVTVTWEVPADEPFNLTAVGLLSWVDCDDIVVIEKIGSEGTQASQVIPIDWISYWWEHDHGGDTVSSPQDVTCRAYVTDTDNQLEFGESAGVYFIIEDATKEKVERVRQALTCPRCSNSDETEQLIDTMRPYLKARNQRVRVTSVGWDGHNIQYEGKLSSVDDKRIALTDTRIGEEELFFGITFEYHRILEFEVIEEDA